MHWYIWYQTVYCNFIFLEIMLLVILTTLISIEILIWKWQDDLKGFIAFFDGIQISSSFYTRVRDYRRCVSYRCVVSDGRWSHPVHLGSMAVLRDRFLTDWCRQRTSICMRLGLGPCSTLAHTMVVLLFARTAVRHMGRSAAHVAMHHVRFFSLPASMSVFSSVLVGYGHR